MVHGQQTAHATYSQNGVLIGLTGLAPLKDCSVRTMEGRVKSVKRKNVMVKFDLDSKKQRMTFEFSIYKLAAAEQMNYFKDFLHKGLKLRASGYACKDEDDDTLEAISIERIY